MWEWVRNIYFLSANQFSNLKMLRVSNNMAPQKGDNGIITLIHIINRQMDLMANRSGDRLDRLERECINDHGKVQSRL